MKQRNTGLHVGKYRKNRTFSSRLTETILPSALIFCALAGLLTTVTGLTAILSLFASGLIFLALFTTVKHFRKEAILLPAALVILIIIVFLRAALLLNGFAALWNETRDLWAAEQGILLPLAQTDNSGLWLASILLGLFLAALSLALSRTPTLASTLLIVLTVAAGFVHVTLWLILSAGNCPVAVGLAEKYRFRSQLSLARRSCAWNCRISASSGHNAESFPDRQRRPASLAL
ncbi:MAG: hypothetical protein V8T01_05080 [Oscillospiraceae bacterium]